MDVSRMSSGIFLTQISHASVLTIDKENYLLETKEVVHTASMSRMVSRRSVLESPQITKIPVLRLPGIALN